VKKRPIIISFFPTIHLYINWMVVTYSFLKKEGTTLIGPLSTHQHRSLDMLPSPKIEAQICFPWPLLYSYIHGSCTVSKQYGIKLRYYWKRIGERSRNLGTPWELDGNTLPPPPPASTNPKEKKPSHPQCILSLLIGCMKFLFPKVFFTIFNLG
jgi:hypothetical protein